MLKAIIWNARGIKNESTKRRLRKLVNLHNLETMVIFEPMTDDSNMASLAGFIQLPNFFSSANKGGKVWLFWSENLDIQVVECTNQVYNVKVSFLGDLACIASLVYVKCTVGERREL